MHAEDFVLAVLASLPEKKVKGKKRLQKLAFFLKDAGAKIDAHFNIRDFGPFSREVARAAEFLSMKGIIEEKEEPIGASRTFVTIYRLSNNNDANPNRLGEKYERILRQLEKFPTVDLEVAATVQFFRKTGLAPEAARKKTLELKPTKATAPVLRNVDKIISSIRAVA